VSDERVNDLGEVATDDGAEFDRQRAGGVQAVGDAHAPVIDGRHLMVGPDESAGDLGLVDEARPRLNLGETELHRVLTARAHRDRGTYLKRAADRNGLDSSAVFMPPRLRTPATSVVAA
jgi:hypothetical protein